ncbi:MAG TPA: TetR/AcrR family transcriptional regulator [Amycolatopsis sp.]|nr:TetR/AcrR family transcriptional regulator [Amycolatopsis sp.]
MNKTTDLAVDESDTPASKLGPRAMRTRHAILQASKQLFLDLGFAGTRINNITDACGISRAGFYTYFRDKREIFNTLGEQTYHKLLELVSELDRLPRPCTRAHIERWVRHYFAFMDEHGAFILSAQSGPADEQTQSAINRMQMRVWFLLGAGLRSRQKHPTTAPEALGLAALAMLDRSWYHCRAQPLSISTDDVTGVITDYFTAMLEC